MSPLKTTFAKSALIGAMMALSPLALKAQTSAQAFNTNKDSITHVMNTAVVNDNTDPEKGNFESGVVERCKYEAHLYSKDYRGVGIAIYAGKQSIDLAKQWGEKLTGIYADKFGVESLYFVENTGHDNLGISFTFFVNGVPNPKTARSNDEIALQLKAAKHDHVHEMRARPDGYGEKSLLDKETKELLMTPTSDLK